MNVFEGNANFFFIDLFFDLKRETCLIIEEDRRRSLHVFEVDEGLKETFVLLLYDFIGSLFDLKRRKFE